MVYITFLVRHSCASFFLVSSQWESFVLLWNFNSSKFVVSVKHTRRGQDPQKYTSFTRPGKHMSPHWVSWYFILPEFSFSEAISSGKCVPACLEGEAWSPLRNTGLIQSSGKKSPLHHSLQQRLCRNEYQKMVSFTSQYCKFLTPQSSARLFASLLYTVAKTEATLTCLCLFETARGACGNGLEWLQRCAEEPAPWPKAS